MAMLPVIYSLICMVVDAEFCYRKIHGDDDTLAGGSVCRGLIEKTSFPTSRACCNSKDGKAYSTSLVSVAAMLQCRVFLSHH